MNFQYTEYKNLGLAKAEYIATDATMLTMLQISLSLTMLNLPQIYDFAQKELKKTTILFLLLLI